MSSIDAGADGARLAADCAAPLPFSPPRGEFEIWPHRSLGRFGIALLLGGVGIVFIALSVWSLRAGAWPIAVYSTLAAVGFACAVRCNLRSARRAQIVSFHDDAVCVREIGPAARDRRTVAFHPGWVRVELIEGPREETRLMLRQGSRRQVLADFLSDEERAELAKDLRAEIAQRYR